MTASTPSNNDAQASPGNPPSADDFIPAPSEEAASTEITDSQSSSASTLDPSGLPAPLIIDNGISQTSLIIAAAAFLVLAGLLLLLRNAVRRSLISARAPIEAANTASWIWYLVLLATGTLVIAGITAGLFSSMLYVGVTIAVALGGIAVAAAMTSKAKQQR
jgi:hypothetical protein